MMKPPNITPAPNDQPHTPSQQQPPPLPPTSANHPSSTTIAASLEVTNNPITIAVSNQTMIAKTQQPAIVATTAQVQQTPLALTIQPQASARPQVQTAPQTIQAPINTTINHITEPPSQTKIQPNQLQHTITTTATIAPQQAQPIALATTASSGSAPTALVIIPQHATTYPINSTAKVVSKSNSITTPVSVTTAHVTLAATTQSAPIQLQATPTTHIPNITAPIPLAAHQQQSTTVIQPTLANRPPSTLPVVPITAAPAIIKQEPNKYICCLLDNGVRCDRVAGNASFSASIQKIVGTKKMNFALDPTVRHAYICEHHKAIITVAKKSTNLARDKKTNARNYTANNNAHNLASQPISNFNDLSRQQQGLQHPTPVNLELLNNQNRLSNNHAGLINNLPVRPGAQITYTHYQGPNQVAPMDVMMSSSFDNATGVGPGGDSVPSSSSGVDVDLQQLQVNTLRRYKRHFRVQTRPGLNKIQLAESLKGHFRTLPIIEKEAITYFVYIVKCYRNKLDHNPKAD